MQDLTDSRDYSGACMEVRVCQSVVGTHLSGGNVNREKLLEDQVMVNFGGETAISLGKGVAW